VKIFKGTQKRSVETCFYIFKEKRIFCLTIEISTREEKSSEKEIVIYEEKTGRLHRNSFMFSNLSMSFMPMGLGRTRFW
jgi:hypothetical protein